MALARIEEVLEDLRNEAPGDSSLSITYKEQILPFDFCRSAQNRVTIENSLTNTR